MSMYMFLNKIPKDSVKTALTEVSFFNSYWNKSEKTSAFYLHDLVNDYPDSVFSYQNRRMLIA